MDSDADYEALRQRAVQSLSEHLEGMCVGAVTVDRNGRIAWMDEKYKALLGVAEDPRGRPIEELIPNSMLRHVIETGQPMPIDLMDFGDRSFVVIRLPLLGADGSTIGAIGYVLFDRAEYLRPVVSKYQRLQEELSRAQAELAQERRAKYSFSQFIGTSEAVREIKRLGRRAAQMDSTVLLLGETGTGKELLAQAIHAASPRASRPFVGVNVAAIPETLLEAEFFGVAPGAYTGADRRHREGKFQLANGGTLFLDEIGDMSLPLQAKLLRVLQEREIEPLGSNKVMRVDVRIIAATSRDLHALVRDKQFRADLYYRLNVVPITVPPLRERPEDIESIADRILEQLAIQQGTPPRELLESAVDVLREYDWPGNVRELYNTLERVMALTDAPILTAQHIRGVLPGGQGARPAGLPLQAGARPLSEVLHDAERSAIAAALEATGGVKARAAKLLGISRASLYERMVSLGLGANG
ncbi:sigma-54 interaction domain-containing protein [Azospirillum thermophilum]|uniref:Sigma-54-dependent Fis family transcriptional regulator n=1 Tax=Azospirillum thermophilum TaxID=2202148 RepID=A0A2S2CK40_9PROT|nr:sigma 54-interacting transcriptional regulator [Azospirillum thermophilum]AWK84851.1 sigma-54-dependent Fis family transcriptional regulator [Azospirillum thermophilum]